MQTTTRQTLVALFERMGFLSDGVSFEEARAAFNRYVETKYQFNGLVVKNMGRQRDGVEKSSLRSGGH